MNSIELNERIADMFRESRNMSGKSQEYVAKKLGVSKKSIQNWESGFSTPNILTTFEWFDAIGMPMYPHFMSILHPLEIKDIKKNTEESKMRKALDKYIEEIPEHYIKELLFLFLGKHGSCPSGVLELLTAYLQLPLSMRISIAQQIATNYEICETTGLLVDDDCEKPNWQAVNVYAEKAKCAVKQGKKSYISFDK